MTDSPVVIGAVVVVDAFVKLVKGADFWNRHKVVPAEAADIAFYAALFVRSCDTGLAVEDIDVVVGPKGYPAVGLDTLAGESDDLRDRSLEVVVVDLARGHSAEDFERMHVTLEEGFLAAGS